MDTQPDGKPKNNAFAAYCWLQRHKNRTKENTKMFTCIPVHLIDTKSNANI